MPVLRPGAVHVGSSSANNRKTSVPMTNAEARELEERIAENVAKLLEAE